MMGPLSPEAKFRWDLAAIFLFLTVPTSSRWFIPRQMWFAQ
jgi:hypothetical protein